MTRIILGLHAEGQKISREILSQLSPYLTRHISRFGDYVVDLSRQLQPLDEESELQVREDPPLQCRASIPCGTVLHVFLLYPSFVLRKPLQGFHPRPTETGRFRAAAYRLQ